LVGDGAVTGTWVGPVRTIIFHEPALASAFAGVIGGRISVEGMSLLQLELANARTIEAAMKVNLGRVLGFEVMRFAIMGWLAFRRRGCT
jgi:hypothetical protein